MYVRVLWVLLDMHPKTRLLRSVFYMISKTLFSSKSDDWSTPLDLFEELDREFNFTLDPCSNDLNAKCLKHFTKKENGLLQSWVNEVVFCNPPYGKVLPLWIKKAYDEHFVNGVTVVLLIPSRTDTKYFHDYIYGKAEIRFIRGRLKFNDTKTPAPFPSMIVVYR